MLQSIVTMTSREILRKRNLSKMPSWVLAIDLNQKSFSSVRKCDFKKLSLIVTSRYHKSLYDTHSGVLFSRVKFDICTFCNFQGIKHTYRHMGTIALYINSIH